MPDYVIEGSFFGMLFLSIVWCLPPFLALKFFVRSYMRAARRGLAPTRFLAAVAAMIVVFIYNVGVLLATGIAVSHGGAQLDSVHGLAFAASWISFWLWLFLRIALGRDFGRKSGLR